MEGRNQRAGAEWLPRPLAAPLRGYPADSSNPGYHHSAALDRGRREELLGRRIRILVGFTQTVTTEQKDFRVLD
jgi:hypothetical protein